jgi:hypothetical protein
MTDAAMMPTPAANCPDRRRSSRETQNLPAWLSSAAGGRSESGHNVTLVDLSIHGAGFRSDVPLRPGDAHWLVVAGSTLRLSTRLKIVTCRPHPDGRGHLCGAEFF